MGGHEVFCRVVPYGWGQMVKGRETNTAGMPRESIDLQVRVHVEQGQQWQARMRCERLHARFFVCFWDSRSVYGGGRGGVMEAGRGGTGERQLCIAAVVSPRE